jgi:hypothetical protein
LPFYNELPPAELPYEFLVLYDWATFFAGAEETMAYLSEVPKPPKKVLATPEKFYKWVDRAREYMKKDKKDTSGNIMPFGESIEDEEDYYKFWGI